MLTPVESPFQPPSIRSTSDTSFKFSLAFHLCSMLIINLRTLSSISCEIVGNARVRTYRLLIVWKWTCTSFLRIRAKVINFYLSLLPVLPPFSPTPSLAFCLSLSHTLYLPLFPCLIFLGMTRISSMARSRPLLEASHSAVPLVAPLDHNRPLCHCQSTLASAVGLLPKNQIWPETEIVSCW